MAINSMTAKDAYLYARYVIKGRWLPGEDIIATDSWFAYWHAYEVIKGPYPEGEPIIATNPVDAYYYARNVIKGRWLPGELTIMLSDYAIEYAKLCELDSCYN